MAGGRVERWWALGTPRQQPAEDSCLTGCRNFSWFMVSARFNRELVWGPKHVVAIVMVKVKIVVVLWCIGIPKWKKEVKAPKEILEFNLKKISTAHEWSISDHSSGRGGVAI
ncbi:hypothetical protein L7F22_041025, partial [Adiantum nelumboides]|nr:hypothetical protein [Adiantum nelumboides]